MWLAAAAAAHGQLHLPPGFTANVYFRSGPAGNLRRPTSLAFDSAGRLYVAELGGRILLLSDSDADGEADRLVEFASGLGSSTGIALHDGALYASSRGSVVRLRDRDGDGRADERQVIIGGLPTGRHQNNGIAFGPDGLLYHCVGSRSDGSEANLEVLPREASIVRASPQGEGLEVFASGLRNCYDLAFHPVSGELYASDNGRDLPDSGVPEELNLIVAGGDYGWPDCWGNAGGSNCRGTIPPIATLQAHSSADGLAFSSGTRFPGEYRHNLFVALFGANSGDPTIGKRVVRIRLPEAGEEAQVADFALGFENPLDLAFGPDGSLYVADYGAETIYRISFVGSGEEGPPPSLAPRLRLRASAPTYQRGDTLVLELEAENAAAAAALDPYVAIILPGGQFVTLLAPLAFSQLGEVHRYKAALPTSGPEVLVRFSASATLEAGEYRLLAVLARRDADPVRPENQLSLEQTSFTLLP